MEEIKVSEMLQADSISKNDSVMIIQGGVNKQAKGDIAEATGTSLSLSSVADTCKVKSNSVNLVNPDTLLLGYQIDSSGTIASNSNRAVTDYIAVKPDTDYIVSGATTKVRCFYDSSKTLISGTTFSGTFTTPSETAYVRYGIDSTADYSQMQLEEGSTATSYNPYNTEVTITKKNLYNNNHPNIIDGVYIAYSQGNFNTNSSTKTLYVRCKPNTTYTISKSLASKRFYVATSPNIPKSGDSFTNAEAGTNDVTTELTITSGANDNYLSVFYYMSSVDTNIAEYQIREYMQIEEGSTATD